MRHVISIFSKQMRYWRKIHSCALEESLRSEAGNDEDSAAADCSRARFNSICISVSYLLSAGSVGHVPYALSLRVDRTFQSSLGASGSKTGLMAFGKG